MQGYRRSSHDYPQDRLPVVPAQVVGQQAQGTRQQHGGDIATLYLALVIHGVRLQLMPF